MPKNKNTSWGHVAKWYNRLLAGDDTYQKELILPNLLRLMNIKKNDAVVDVACGQGFFTREFAKRDARAIGTDIAQSLIDTARRDSPKNIVFYVASAERMRFIKNNDMDKAVIVLSLQNMEDIGGVLRECARILKKGGFLYIVLNHPAFRIPKASSWEWDEKQKTQYRRIDQYLSESKIKIQMHPGGNPKENTISFHRPLQFYFKMLHKAGFAVMGLEEWNSGRNSEPGPRAKAEDKARKEIPLFLCLVCAKL